MKQIYIEDFRVDMSRCTVHRGNESFPLEPKVVRVFLLLAKNQGEVVSHQALLDEVWPNTIVDANALQRCIGQLRKVFNDNAKQQRVIATYPKVGYSLLPDIQWEAPATEQATQKKISKIASFALIAVVLLPALAFFLIPSSKPPYTASEVAEVPVNKVPINSQPPDFYILYSPDERYVMYPKALETDSSSHHLWIQNLFNNDEFLLSTSPGLYGDAAWSFDSQSIGVIAYDCPDTNCQNQECSSLKLFTLISTEDRLIETKNLLNCRAGHLQSPQWIGPNNILLIESNDASSTIINYDLNLASSTLFFQQTGIAPRHLAYSEEAGILIITVLDSNQQRLLLLSIASNELSSISPLLPEKIMNEPWYPAWNSQNDKITLSTSDGVYTIELDGSVYQQGLPYIPSND